MSPCNEALAAAVESLKDQHILIIGDVMLDHYVWGEVERISPEAPVPVVHVRKETELPGGAANVARNIVALGATATLIGIVGQGKRAESLREICDIDGIDAKFAADPRPTTTKVRFISQNQQLLRADWEDDAVPAPETCDELERLVAEALPSCDMVILSDYAKGVIRPELVGQLRQSGKRVVVDPKPSQKELYPGFYLMTPNHNEAAALTGGDPYALPPTADAAALRQDYCENVLITCGAHGMYLHGHDDHTATIPSRARQVYEVSGAGDTVVAVVTLALSTGLSLHEAAVMANHAAGLVVGKVGTATVSPQELRNDLLNFED